MGRENTRPFSFGSFVTMFNLSTYVDKLNIVTYSDYVVQGFYFYSDL